MIEGSGTSGDTSNRSPTSFALGGASVQERPDTLPAYALARRLGARGVASWARRTSDDGIVLARSATLRQGIRKRRLSSLPVASLPDTTVTLDEFYRAAGPVALPLWLDVGDGDTAESAIALARAVMQIARDHEQAQGLPLLSKLWIGHGDVRVLAALRAAGEPVRLINHISVAHLPGGRHGLERRAATLASEGIDAAAMSHSDWTGGTVVLFGRFDVLAFGSAVEHEHHMDALLAMGLHALSSSHVDRMADAWHRAGW